MDDDDGLGYWPAVYGPFMRLERWRDKPLTIVSIEKTDGGFTIEMKERA